MKINTNDEKDYRTDLYERTAVGTKSGGIDATCELSTQMLRNLERAAGLHRPFETFAVEFHYLGEAFRDRDL